MEEINICGRNLLNLDVTEGRKNIDGDILVMKMGGISIGGLLEVFDIPLISELFRVVFLNLASTLNN